jgi:hypothetical protein
MRPGKKAGSLQDNDHLAGTPGNARHISITGRSGRSRVCEDCEGNGRKDSDTVILFFDQPDGVVPTNR